MFEALITIVAYFDFTLKKKNRLFRDDLIAILGT